MARFEVAAGFINGEIKSQIQKALNDNGFEIRISKMEILEAYYIYGKTSGSCYVIADYALVKDTKTGKVYECKKRYIADEDEHFWDVEETWDWR